MLFISDYKGLRPLFRFWHKACIDPIKTIS